MPVDDSLCGLFGGTFDPIHRGHLAPLREVQARLQAAGLARIIYLPAARPPHRRQPVASAPQRLAMTRIAVADEPQFAVDDIELSRPGDSYTVATLAALRQQNPHRRYALIVGLDALLALETWHRWQTLQRSVHIIAMARPGWRLPKPLPSWWQAARVESGAELRRTVGGKILFMETTPQPISATLVRARLAAGEAEAVLPMLPSGVWDYICAHNLYRNETGDG